MSSRDNGSGACPAAGADFHSLLVSGADAPTLLARARERLSPLAGRHNLGVVYLSDHLAADAAGLLEGLRLCTGVEHWVGGVALGVCSDQGEAFDEPAMSLLLASVPEDSFRVFAPGRLPGDDPGLRRWCAERSPYVGLVHADPRHQEVPATLETLAGDAAPFLVGGLLSSRGAYPQVADQVHEGPLSGVLFTDALTVVTRLSQGCSPIGPRHQVTRAEGMRVVELDHRPAVEVLAEDLSADGGDAGGVHVALPRRGSDTGDYLVRDILGVDSEERALVIGHEVRVGDDLMFARRDEESARRDLERMLEGLARAVPSPVRAGIYVSCLARGPNLFAEAGLETRLIRERLGEFPLTGFFANGEIAGDRLYGYTGVLTLIC